MDFLFTKDAKPHIKCEMDDVENSSPSEFLSNEWSEQADDFLDSFFSFADLDDLSAVTPNMNEITSNLIAGYDRVSPISSEPEPEFKGFSDVDTSKEDIDFPMAMTMMTDSDSHHHHFDMNDVRMEQAMSSSASDSGLSSDHLDLDMSPDYEPLSPALSSPGPSISERGHNSPHRMAEVSVVPKKPPVNLLMGRKIMTPVTLTAVRPAAIVAATTAAMTPKVVVEKVQPATGNLMFNKTAIAGQIQMPTIAKTMNGKEVKIYRMAPGQTMPMVGGTPKKVTIQLKSNSTPKMLGAASAAAAIMLNKTNGAPTVTANKLSGVRKLIRVQNPSNPRSILLPVSLQDVNDLRKIKIINAASMKNKSANVQLAAANLLQQTKKTFVQQKNILLPPEHLLADDSYVEQTSDADSFIFEEVMQQSSSVIEAIERDQSETYDDDDEDDDDDDDGVIVDDRSDDDVRGRANGALYPKLILTNEEKRLLSKEGIALPASYPLTKHEERELKRIRRKIRNKISAQDSRKRKKEYVDGLEERVKQCTEENQTLMKRIKILQSQNHNLVGQMKKLQALLTKGTSKTAQPATCLMVLLLSMALVAVPNLKLGAGKSETELANALQESLAQNRRSLLYDAKNAAASDTNDSSAIDDEMNLDDLLAFSGLVDDDELVKVEDALDGVESNATPVPAKRAKGVYVDFDVDDGVYRMPPAPQPAAVAHKTDFEKMAGAFQANLKDMLQSSGFNIDAAGSDSDHSIELDKDILEMVSPTANGRYELNFEHLMAANNVMGLAGTGGPSMKLTGGDTIDFRAGSLAIDHTIDDPRKRNASHVPSAGGGTAKKQQMISQDV